jgi:hypothetical protein
MLYWFEKELYVLESTYAWYMPFNKNGVQMNKFDDWLPDAKNAGFEMVWLPLNDKYRAKFNST